MNKRLTLLLDEQVIENAKRYAVERNTTLAGLVQKYLSILLAGSAGVKRGTRTEIKRNIRELTGIIRIPDDIDVKQEYRKSRMKHAVHD